MLLAGCASPAPAPVESPEERALLADFQRVVYGAARPVLGNSGEARPRRDHLAKWETPIRAALIGAQSGLYEPATRRHLEELGRLTGLDIAEASPAAANLLIFFAEDPFEAARRHRALFAHRIMDPRSFDALLARMEESATCFGLLWGGWPSGRGIDFSVVFIRTGRGGRTVQGCLVQETTQVLGLMHDLEPEADSVFSDSGRQVDLTGRDRILLRLLYDARLKPGMGWAEAEPLARTALREIQAGPAPAGG
ncbi:MAG: DUF2927 domain-containing protein [Kiloniellaceae bacterium]